MKLLKHFQGQSIRQKYRRPVMPHNKSLYSVLDNQFNTLECKECNKKMKQVSWNHLFYKHDGMTIEQYKIKYHLPFHQGLTSSQTRAKKRLRQEKLMKEGKVKLISSIDPRFKVYRGIVRRSPRQEIKNKEQSEKMKKLFENDDGKFIKFKEAWKHNYISCRVCLLPEKIKIEMESMIKQGYSDNAVEKKYGLNVQQHRWNHMNIFAEKGDKGYLRRKSERKEMKCIVCNKKFIYYHYSYNKYERKLCSNKCKSIFMKL